MAKLGRFRIPSIPVLFALATLAAVAAFGEGPEWVALGPYGGGEFRGMAMATYAGTLFVPHGAGVLKSADGGETWRNTGLRYAARVACDTDAP